MTTKIKEEYRNKMMTLIRDHDLYEFFIFDEQLKYVVICSDVFYWGAADAEVVEYEDIDLLEESLNEINNLNHNSTMSEFDALILFCVKKRKILPQEKVLKNTDKQIVELFIKSSKNIE